jgi:hypothetical protein
MSKETIYDFICPLKLRKEDRPATCDNVTCELFCELYIKEHNLKFYKGRGTRRKDIRATDYPTYID